LPGVRVRLDVAGELDQRARLAVFDDQVQRYQGVERVFMRFGEIDRARHRMVEQRRFQLRRPDTRRVRAGRLVAVRLVCAGVDAYLGQGASFDAVAASRVDDQAGRQFDFCFFQVRGRGGVDVLALRDFQIEVETARRSCDVGRRPGFDARLEFERVAPGDAGRVADRVGDFPVAQ